MEPIIISFAVLGALGIIFGVGLGIASKKFAVEVDERVSAVRELLPGANCGGCGFPGCDGFAAAVVEGTAEPNGCAPNSAENAAAIAKVIGKAVDLSGGKKVARLICMGDKESCGDKSAYNGPRDCKAAVLVAGGFKKCATACLGLGTCETVCPFDAIKIGEDGLCHIDEEKCTGCGKCVEACPKAALTLMPQSVTTYVACRNCNKGKVVMNECKVGCIACGKCVKACPFEAITMENNIPVINYELCRQCQACADACPKNIIAKAENTKKAAINAEKCVGCTLCKKACPFEAISGEVKEKHVIDPEKCRGCGACVEKCKLKAITME